MYLNIWYLLKKYLYNITCCSFIFLGSHGITSPKFRNSFRWHSADAILIFAIPVIQSYCRPITFGHFFVAASAAGVTKPNRWQSDGGDRVAKTET